IACTELGNISERRIDLLLRKVNPRLPMFLARDAGLESGFMIAHVTAAALASENKTLAHPASADTVPTSAGQADHVSMATRAGVKLQLVLDNLFRILAIEALASAEAIDLQRPLKTTAQLEPVHASIRRVAPSVGGDRRLDTGITALAASLDEGRLLSE